MPKSNKTNSHKMDSVPNQDEANIQEDSCSEQEIDPDAIVNQPQAFSSMFMPYIEGTKMDWTMNDGLYSRFLKWNLKCKKYLSVSLQCLLRKENARRL